MTEESEAKGKEGQEEAEVVRLWCLVRPRPREDGDRGSHDEETDVEDKSSQRDNGESEGQKQILHISKS